MRTPPTESELIYKTVNRLLEKEKETLDRIKNEIEKEIRERFPDLKLEFSTEHWPRIVTLYSGPKGIAPGRVDPKIRVMKLAILLFDVELSLD